MQSKIRDIPTYNLINRQEKTFPFLSTDQKRC